MRSTTTASWLWRTIPERSARQTTSCSGCCVLPRGPSERCGKGERGRSSERDGGASEPGERCCEARQVERGAGRGG
eukprot:10302604-Alexandrium_andersonii.AAC.1